MNSLIVVPARGGSKGIHLKNIYKIKGIPLIEYTLKSLDNSFFENDFDIVVSSDSKEIIEVAQKYSFVNVIVRPSEISDDTSSTEDALFHALRVMEKTKKIKYENVITLQPTSPLRKTETIIDFIKVFANLGNEFDSQITLTESFSEYWVLDVNEYKRLFEDAPRRRQDRKPIYIENSSIYITRKTALLKHKSVLGKHTNGYIINDEEGVDINEIADIKLAESFL